MALRQFMAACPATLQGARLVQYGCVEFVRALDIAPADIEGQVTECVCEGFSVDWVCRNEVLYLRACLSDGARPSWERVFAEGDLAHVRSILGDAPFEGGA